MSDLKPEVEIIHQQWLEHPMTQMFRKAVIKHRDNLLATAMNKSVSEVRTDNEVRTNVILAKEANDILELFGKADVITKLTK